MVRGTRDAHRCLRVLLWIVIECADAFCQEAPTSLPATLVVEKSFWSFLSTLTMYRFEFIMQQGSCKAAENHCLGQPLTAVECAAECEKHDDCVAFDRPNVFGKAGCCWYPGGQAVVADGSPDKKCFVRSDESPRANSYFGEIWRQPAFQSVAHLSTQADEGAASAVVDLCLPWSHCSFRIFNCNGKPLYALQAKLLPSLDNPLELLWSYEIRNSLGDYVGRTSELQSGYRPIELYDAKGRNVATLSTSWTLWSAVSSGNWYINNEFPTQAPSDVPVLDARLVTFVAAHQFAMQGWFGPFWTFVMWCGVLCIVGWTLKRFGLQWLQGRYEPLHGKARGMWCSSEEAMQIEEPKVRACHVC